MNKAKKQQRAVKQKLLAAVAMLMVSAIMVVSSSYAWFTLSTAPEVTGIQTSVGANGNLEMALNNGGTITSNVGDSTKELIEKNVTWGNLVDLSEGYGLDRVQLMPSRLTFKDGALQQSLLQVPTYGADGRVNTLVDVLQGKYENGAIPVLSSGNGVRLFGTSSGMSDEQLALRSATLNFNSYMSSSKGKAASSLTNNGGLLADMAITHGLDSAGTATFNRAQVESLNNVVVALEAAAGDIETALKYAVKAAATSQAGGHTFSIENKSLEEVIAEFETSYATASATVSYLETYVQKLNDLKSDIADAKNVLNTALTGENETKSEFVWTDFNAAIDALMNSTGITVNGMTISQVKDDPGALANKYMEDKEILMVIPTGGGVFADIADFTDDFSAPVTIPKISYDKLALENVPATMKADCTLTEGAYVNTIKTGIQSITASGGTGAQSLSDLYAYAIDLAFRTNAADSDLLLQTVAADRIYENNTYEGTMGGGSYMEFTVATGYKLETAKELMKCIRVVFMSTNDGSTGATAPTIYNVAVLDVDQLTTTANGTVKVPLKIAQYEIANNELVVKTDVNTGKILFAADDQGEYDATITSLDQNVQKNVTALVYLDGNKVDNSMVANAENSLSGKLNLQFASSSTLIPMEYSDLHIPNDATEATN